MKKVNMGLIGSGFAASITLIHIAESMVWMR